jgi:hypothetical protein
MGKGKNKNKKKKIKKKIRKVVYLKKPKVLASSHGLVVKAENSWLRGRGFKTPLRRPFFRHHSFGSIAWSKNWVEINLALLQML